MNKTNQEHLINYFSSIYEETAVGVSRKAAAFKLAKEAVEAGNLKNNNLRMTGIVKVKANCPASEKPSFHYAVKVYGGLNGRGRWVDYLNGIVKILKKLGPTAYVIDLLTDTLDDVFDVIIGFRTEPKEAKKAPAKKGK